MRSGRRVILLLAACLATGPAAAWCQQPPGGSSLLGRAGDVSRGQASTGATSATEGARRDRIQLATINGGIELRNRLLAVSIGRDVTVRDFLEKTDSLDAIDEVVKAAVPQGRPVETRHTCQVRLTVSGAKLLARLQAVALARPDRAPVKGEQLRASASWATESYTATGLSADAEAAEQAPRPDTPAWSTVSDADCRKAVGTARDQAIRQTLDALGKVKLGTGGRAADQTLAASLARPAVARRVLAFLNAQPVSPVDFHDDLGVSLTLYVNRHDLAAAVKEAVQAEPTRPAEARWDQVSASIEQMPATVVGVSRAERPAGSGLETVVLPIQPPAGVGATLTVSGKAARASTRLLTQHAAEVEAAAKLRDQFVHLKVGPNATLDDALRSDPALSAKVDRALKKATAKVTYNADGSAVVTLTLDVAGAWEKLR